MSCCQPTASYEINTFCEVENEKRRRIAGLWKVQLSELTQFFSKKKKLILHREEEAAALKRRQEHEADRLVELQRKADQEAKRKANFRELSVDDLEFFVRNNIVIQEEETWERFLLWNQWMSIAHKTRCAYFQCIGQHYQFSMDIHKYIYMQRSLAARDLHDIKPVDRHLPKNLLVNLRKRKVDKQVEEKKMFDRLRGTEMQNVSF